MFIYVTKSRKTERVKETRTNEVGRCMEGRKSMGTGKGGEKVWAPAGGEESTWAPGGVEREYERRGRGRVWSSTRVRGRRGNVDRGIAHK